MTVLASNELFAIACYYKIFSFAVFKNLWASKHHGSFDVFAGWVKNDKHHGMIFKRCFRSWVITLKSKSKGATKWWLRKYITNPPKRSVVSLLLLWLIILLFFFIFYNNFEVYKVEQIPLKMKHSYPITFYSNLNQ